MDIDRDTFTGQLVDDLSYSYTGIFEPDDVRTAVDEAWEAIATRSRIPAFIPVLVTRRAREQLMARAQAEGRVVKKVPELLFVCVHNAGRSQMAAALAEHLSARRVHVRSAGSAADPGGDIYPLVVDSLRERGIAMDVAYPKPLSDSVVRAADVIITMGCGDTCPYYPGKRYEDWDVRDPADQPIEVVREIRDDIQARVTTLLRQILN
ncbi:MAG: low molecular weight phosphatase family protein [Nigerium sp.]|nr:low molecular weight phosphatase family protein [Nigerium sp.]